MGVKLYDITDHKYERPNADICNWLSDCLTKDQYYIVNNGFLIDNYCVGFKDPKAETLYLLRWT